MNLDSHRAATSLGRALQLRRTELGMKRRDLALAARLSYPYVSEIENGRKEPSPRAFRQLADAVGLSPGDLHALAGRAEALDDDPHGSSLLVEPSRLAAAQIHKGQSTRGASGPVNRAAASGVFSDRIEGGWIEPRSRPAAPSGPLDRAVTELVRREVQAALREWTETQLPQVIRDEVERAIRERDRP